MRYYHIFIRVSSLIIGLILLKQNNNVALITAINFCIISLLLSYINKKTNLKLNYIDLFIIDFFLLSATFLGGGLNLYKKFFWWDILVHLLSGVSFTIIGIKLNKKLEFSNKYMVLITLLIVMSTALTWEIIEFILDSSFNTNLQEWNNMSKELISSNIGKRGHGLVDSMLDMIYAIVGYLATIKVLE